VVIAVPLNLGSMLPSKASLVLITYHLSTAKIYSQDSVIILPE
jgi:hypothetical protein